MLMRLAEVIGRLFFLHYCVEYEILLFLEDARRSGMRNAVQKGERSLFHSMQTLMRKHYWKKLTKISSADSCSHLRTRLLSLVSPHVAELIRTQKNDAASNLFDFLTAIAFDPNAPCREKEMPLAVARKSGNEIAAVYLFRRNAHPRGFCHPNESLMNAVSEWTMELNSTHWQSCIFSFL